MKLKNFVMVMFANDTMVVPKESEVSTTVSRLYIIIDHFKTQLTTT